MSFGPPPSPLPYSSVFSGRSDGLEGEPAYDFEPARSPPAPLLCASPHSGWIYPMSMQASLAVPVERLRQMEDSFVAELFSAAPELGAGLLSARFARAVVDLNRDVRELDAAMFEDGAPRPCGIATARVEAGLGCLPRLTGAGEPIYARRLLRQEAEARLSQIYDPYHARLARELGQLETAFGGVVLIDAHSMPSAQPGKRGLADIVLGDRFGASCDGRLTRAAELAFRAEGFSVARNAPYAGGYVTRCYGVPRRGVHALQIEINRGLYMDEVRREPSAGFGRVQNSVTEALKAMRKAAWAILEH